MKKALYICFTGIDGSGKTTVSKKLQTEYASRGFSTRYLHNRYNPVLLYIPNLIGKKLFLSKSDYYKNYINHSNAKKEIFKNSLLSNIYQNLLIIDYFLQTYPSLIYSLIKYDIVISDRYIYDTVLTDLAVDFNNSDEKNRSILSRSFNFFPKPSLCFFIDIPEDIAFKRKNDTPSIDYLIDRKNQYLMVSKENDMIIINGNQELNTEIKDVKKVIDEKILCR
ncbi:nucleoside/nucleotide kinase family protein [Methanogenium organophilum]|uniref:Thymidylate kinase n=1 Tax=Methanogenium organophilum TaxID=2199 RepID=A0A9X9S3G5_METOG|nr:hypothetical protein [Methanogenium organophilum]WAI00846.1 hypothetical protein OU421_10545 [Methanogenium organophilum]